MLTAPVSVTLFACRKIYAIAGVVVAAVIIKELPANVVTRSTTLLRRSVGIALAVVGVTGTVEGVVEATVNCRVDTRQ